MSIRLTFVATIIMSDIIKFYSAVFYGVIINQYINKTQKNICKHLYFLPCQSNIQYVSSFAMGTQTGALPIVPVGGFPSSRSLRL